jgi:hypothetical protein
MECKLEALSTLGRKDEAAEVLLQEIKAGRLSLNQQVLDTLLPMLGDTAARDQLLSILIEQITNQGSHGGNSGKHLRFGRVPPSARTARLFRADES